MKSIILTVSFTFKGRILHKLCTLGGENFGDHFVITPNFCFTLYTFLVFRNTIDVLIRVMRMGVLGDLLILWEKAFSLLSFSLNLAADFL